MTATDNDTATRAGSMAAAYGLCGWLMDQIPAGVVITSWEFMEGYSDCSARAGLRKLADLLGVEYREEPLTSLVRVEASGVIDGIKVQLYAHIDLPRHSVEDGA